MTLLFTLKKWFLGDTFLQLQSASIADLQQDLKGRKVAVVGNARSLANQTHGPEIDSCDIVIRMHAAPLPTVASHGSKTTWLALGMPVPQPVIVSRNPNRLLWMAKKRKRLRQRFLQCRGFYLHPTAEWDRLAQVLKAPPTTGAMLIDLVAQSDARDIHLFGFDFFASLSLSGSRTAKQVPHDFAAEKEFVEALMANDHRVVLHTKKA